MGLQEWKEKVKLLEQGISPDDLPINPHEIMGEANLYDVPEGIKEGYYSYTYYKRSVDKIVKGWYMIRRLGEEKQL